MLSKNVLSILVGLALATFDLFNLGAIKNVSTGAYPRIIMWVVTGLYAMQPWIFLKGLNFTSMTVLNLSWDLLSDILVTLSGVLYFRESLTEYKFIGVLFSLLAITVFAMEGASEIAN